MRVDLYRPRDYDFHWPTITPEGSEPIPEGEKIVVKCRRLSRGAKRKIDDAMVSVSGSRIDRASKAKSVGDMSLGYSIGTTKDMRLKESVDGWENVEDSKGNPIKFTWDSFTELLACNANLDPDGYGLLESELLERIESENSFADTTQLTGKNSQKSSSGSLGGSSEKDPLKKS